MRFGPSIHYYDKELRMCLDEALKRRGNITEQLDAALTSLTADFVRRVAEVNPGLRTLEVYERFRPEAAHRDDNPPEQYKCRWLELRAWRLLQFSNEHNVCLAALSDGTLIDTLAVYPTQRWDLVAEEFAYDHYNPVGVVNGRTMNGLGAGPPFLETYPLAAAQEDLRTRLRRVASANGSADFVLRYLEELMVNVLEDLRMGRVPQLIGATTHGWVLTPKL